MQINSLFNFDYSYLSLPERFFTLIKPGPFSGPETFLLNDKLCDELNLSSKNRQDFAALLSGESCSKEIRSFAQAYSGHQFGHFTNLGDGRAIIIGEHLTRNNERFDIQIKGAGRTIYSRGGDGKATLRAMLREYLVSEAIHNLNIPTSRSLAVIKTGQSVYRETTQEGAALVRVMKSHIRAGTFEYAAYFGSADDLKALVSYTINRLYPEIEQDDIPVLSLLNNVMENQIELIVNWMRVGFIHGVMNTDNTSISGETFDYGPCAFMNVCNAETVYSSIDHSGRYAFGNQPEIIRWNLARFAETLLPVIHPDPEKALELAQNSIDSFDGIWREKYYNTMLNKIGIEDNDPQLYVLVDELMGLMQKLKMDYTNTFLALLRELSPGDITDNRSELRSWLDKWKYHIDKSGSAIRAKELMEKSNPVYIPRNHLVEQALDDAVNGSTGLFERLMGLLSQPYHYKDNTEEFMNPSDENFEKAYQTFCGT